MTQEASGSSYFIPGINNCEREPVHIIGRIQSIGYLLVLDRENRRIVQASENISDLTGVPVQELIGKSVDQFFPYTFLEYLQKFIDPGDPLDHHSLKIEHRQRNYILSTHLSEGYMVLEIEKDNEEGRESSYFHYSDLVDNIILDIDLHDSIEDICRNVIVKTREITGFNRMMVYRFDDEGHGQVIAESMEEGMRSYKGLKFPASDIPPQARALYLKNTIRGIWDVEGDTSAIYPVVREEDQKPLDLTKSFLRSVSPIHVEYLRNMEVRSSFSVSIIVKDRLWGLILCHHTDKPVKLNVYQRRACQFIGKVLSHKIENKSEDLRFRHYRDKLQALHRIISSYLSSSDLNRAVRENSGDLLEAFSGSGYAVLFEEELIQSGNMDSLWLNQLITEIQLKEEVIYYTNEISYSFPNLPQMASAPGGVLALKLSQNLNEFLLIFREEQQKEIHWAGQPHNGGPAKSLSPRSSFDKWTEMVEKQAPPWHRDDIQFAREFRTQLIENIIIATNQLKHGQNSGKNKLRMRLIERVYELEETNKRMENELQALRRREVQHRLAREIAEERSQLRAIKSL